MGATALKMTLPLTDDAKWTAVRTCDKSYDGIFFYGVSTTGIFCRPSCTAKTPLRRNILFFDRAEDAGRHGFRPCKKCRPDLHGYDPKRELVEKAKQAYAHSFDDSSRLNRLLSQIGVSSTHLMRMFRQYEGCTQGQYLTRLRIEKAMDYLCHTEMAIVEIALYCGFESLSNFYKRFRKQTGVTPAQFRLKGVGRP